MIDASRRATSVAARLASGSIANVAGNGAPHAIGTSAIGPASGVASTDTHMRPARLPHAIVAWNESPAAITAG